MAGLGKVSGDVEDTIEQWRALGTRIGKIVGPVAEQHIQIIDSLKPVIEAQKALEKSLVPILKQQRKWADVIGTITFPHIDTSTFDQIAKQTEDYQRSIERLISPALEKLNRSFRELPPRTQEAILLLGKHGWYLDLDLPIPALWQLKESLEKGDVEEAEQALKSHFSERLDEIQRMLGQKFPQRKCIFDAAFDAHRRGEYVLSIPVLLAQADGICKEVAKAHLFIKRRSDGKPGTASYVEEVAADTYRAALLSPLAYALPIAASEGERGEDFSGLNRHVVLHGESLDYGTEVNGLKAVSLIHYVAHILRAHDESS